MKYSLIFGIAVLFSIPGRGQKRNFFSHDGQETDSASSYYYAPVEDFRDYGNDRVDTSRMYYTATGKVKSMRVRKGYKPFGPFEEYYDNGVVALKGYCEGSVAVGITQRWYANGAMCSETKNRKNGDSNQEIMVNYWDSLGNQMVTNGEGFLNTSKFIDSYLADASGNGDARRLGRVEGRYKEGLRDSVWSGYDNDKLVFHEAYNRGVLKSGVSFRDSREYHYTAVSKMAEYHGGLGELMKFIQHNMTYPKVARKARMEGRVFVAFMIGEKGDVQEEKVLKKVYPALDEEALRVVSLLPPWSPGELRGVPIRTRFVLPINFRLQ